MAANALEVVADDPEAEEAAAGIPIRNLWLLLVYASGLARFLDRFDAEVEASPDLPSLLARLLTVVVERRLRRNLSRAYQPRATVLGRVRGRIDMLPTLGKALLQRGQVACRFEEQNVDTARNRLVRAALVHIAGRVREHELAHACRSLAGDLDRLGVGPGRPTRGEMARDRIARHEAADLLMTRVAELALDLALPSEADGVSRLTRLDRDSMTLHDVFERAVAGFYDHELGSGWTVRTQPWLFWQSRSATAGLSALLPRMRPDLVIHDRRNGRRIVLDTKFTGILTPGYKGGERFKSGHIYQLYSYLRSQAETGDPAAQKAEGVLLHPSLGRNIDEAVTIDGHRVRFATVDLAASSERIRRRLLSIVQEPI